MTSRWNPAWVGLPLVAISAIAAACQSDMTAPATARTTVTTLASRAGAAARSMNGKAGQMPAYYDGHLFTVNMKEQPGNASASLIAKNKSINEIYASNDLDEEQEFVPVLDAIQGDGFNPLWRQNLIVFNPGFTPHQFFSDTDVLSAAAGGHPEIHIVATDEVYRCAVVGHK